VIAPFFAKPGSGPRSAARGKMRDPYITRGWLGGDWWLPAVEVKN
jgi:hypothetical protein